MLKELFFVRFESNNEAGLDVSGTGDGGESTMAKFNTNIKIILYGEDWINSLFFSFSNHLFKLHFLLFLGLLAPFQLLVWLNIRFIF